MRFRPLALAAFAAALASGSAALADPAPRPLTLRPPNSAPAGHSVRPLALPYSRIAPEALPVGIARTSIDRRFEREGVSASAGFICGRPENPEFGGSAGARGTDPNGRFVGASLRLSFGG